MKKNICLLLTLLIVAVSMNACGEQAVALDVSATADELAKAVPFTDQLNELDESMITKIYDISSDDFTNAKVYTSTGATPEEIAVFQAKDDDAVKKIEFALKERIKEQKASFEDYVPAEMPKLESPFMITKGRFVILCISDHNDTAKNIIDNMAKA